MTATLACILFVGMAIGFAIFVCLACFCAAIILGLISWILGTVAEFFRDLMEEVAYRRYLKKFLAEEVTA